MIRVFALLTSFLITACASGPHQYTAMPLYEEDEVLTLVVVEYKPSTKVTGSAKSLDFKTYEGSKEVSRTYIRLDLRDGQCHLIDPQDHGDPLDALPRRRLNRAEVMEGQQDIVAAMRTACDLDVGPAGDVRHDEDLMLSGYFEDGVLRAIYDQDARRCLRPEVDATQIRGVYDGPEDQTLILEGSESERVSYFHFHLPAWSFHRIASVPVQVQQHRAAYARSDGRVMVWRAAADHVWVIRRQETVELVRAGGGSLKVYPIVVSMDPDGRAPTLLCARDAE